MQIARHLHLACGYCARTAPAPPRPAAARSPRCPPATSPAAHSLPTPAPAPPRAPATYSRTGSSRATLVSGVDAANTAIAPGSSVRKGTPRIGEPHPRRARKGVIVDPGHPGHGHDQAGGQHDRRHVARRIGRRRAPLCAGEFAPTAATVRSIAKQIVRPTAGSSGSSVGQSGTARLATLLYRTVIPTHVNRHQPTSRSRLSSSAPSPSTKSGATTLPTKWPV